MLMGRFAGSLSYHGQLRRIGSLSLSLSSISILVLHSETSRLSQRPCAIGEIPPGRESQLARLEKNHGPRTVATLKRFVYNVETLHLQTNRKIASLNGVTEGRHQPNILTLTNT